MKKWKCKYLLIDFDGTIFDTEADIVASVNHVRRANNLEPLELKVGSSFVGEGVITLIRKSFADFTQDEQKIDELLKEFRKYYLKNAVVETKLYDGVKETLAKFKHKIVLSNKSEDMLHEILNHFNYADEFLQIIGGDTFEVKKPTPGLLELMKSEYSISDLEDAVMIGDGQPDHDFAKNLGLPFICCNYGISRVKDDYENMVRIDSFPEILDYLEPDV